MASNYSSYASPYPSQYAPYYSYQNKSGLPFNPSAGYVTRSHSSNDISMALNQPIYPYYVPGSRNLPPVAYSTTNTPYAAQMSVSPRPYAPSSHMNSSSNGSARPSFNQAVPNQSVESLNANQSTANTENGQPSPVPATLSRYRGRHLRALSANSISEDAAQAMSNVTHHRRAPYSVSTSSSSDISADSESLITQASMSSSGSLSSGTSWPDEDAKPYLKPAVQLSKPVLIKPLPDTLQLKPTRHKVEAPIEKVQKLALSKDAASRQPGMASSSSITEQGPKSEQQNRASTLILTGEASGQSLSITDEAPESTDEAPESTDGPPESINVAPELKHLESKRTPPRSPSSTPSSQKSSPKTVAESNPRVPASDLRPRSLYSQRSGSPSPDKESPKKHSYENSPKLSAESTAKTAPKTSAAVAPKATATPVPTTQAPASAGCAPESRMMAMLKPPAAPEPAKTFTPAPAPEPRARPRMSTDLSCNAQRYTTAQRSAPPRSASLQQVTATARNSILSPATSTSAPPAQQTPVIRQSRSFGSKLRDIFSSKSKSRKFSGSENDDDTQSVMSSKSTFSVRSASSVMSFQRFRRKRSSSDSTDLNKVSEHTCRSGSPKSVVTTPAQQAPPPLPRPPSPALRSSISSPALVPVNLTTEKEEEVAPGAEPIAEETGQNVMLNSVVSNNSAIHNNAIQPLPMSVEPPASPKEQTNPTEKAHGGAISLSRTSSIRKNEAAPPNLTAGDIFPGKLKSDDVETIVSSIERTGSFKRQPSTSRRTEEEIVPNAQKIEVEATENASNRPVLKSAIKSHRRDTARRRSGATTTRSVSFASQILVYKTFSSHAYDRTPDRMTCDTLSRPEVAQRLREELNQWKLLMNIHPESRGNTQFFHV